MSYIIRRRGGPLSLRGVSSWKKKVPDCVCSLLHVKSLGRRFLLLSEEVSFPSLRRKGVWGGGGGVGGVDATNTAILFLL